MELFVILLVSVVLLYLEIWLHFRRIRTYNELTKEIVLALGPTIARLDPDSRYILSLPESLSVDEFEESVKTLRDSLGLENSNIHIVIVHGNVTMVEFS